MKFLTSHARIFILAVIMGLVLTAPALSQPTGATTSDQGKKQKMKYAIAIHGGAGSSPAQFSDQANQQRHDALKNALDVGTAILKSGGSSLDAVEKVVMLLEDDPQFNAGKGAVFNATGGHELDASIMDGATKACGGVVGVSIVKNPVALARKVMTETRHVLLAGNGADAFARLMNVELVEPSYFDTPATLEKWKQSKGRPGQSGFKKLQAQDPGRGHRVLHWNRGLRGLGPTW